MKYSAIVVTNSIERMRFSCEYILAHSMNCNELVVVFDHPNKINSEIIPQIIDEWKKKYPLPIHLLDIGDEQNLDVYEMYNIGVKNSREKLVLLVNDDTYFPPSWDYGVNVDLSDNPVITFDIVEPGYVDVNSKNLRKDFGQTIETFDKAGFDNFAKIYPVNPVIDEGLGWFMPVIFKRDYFLEMGGYPTFPPFPYPNDIIFFEKISKDVKFVHIHSPVYHFQRLSQRGTESDKLNLCCGNNKMVGWLNVDFSTSDKNVDLSFGEIPLPNEKFSQVLFKHALEHFRYEIGINLIEEIYRILRKGGTLDIHVPDVELACEDFLRGYNKLPDCAQAIFRIYGKNDSEQQIHKWGYTSKSLTLLLMTCGFSRVEEIPKRANDEIAIRGWK